MWGGKTNILHSAHINQLLGCTLRCHCVGIKVSLVPLLLLVCLCFVEKKRKPRKNMKKGRKKCLKMPKGTTKKQCVSWEEAWQGYCSLLFSCCMFSGVKYSNLWKPVIFVPGVSSVTLGNLLPQHQCCELFTFHMAQKDLDWRKSIYWVRFSFPVAEGLLLIFLELIIILAGILLALIHAHIFLAFRDSRAYL